MNEIKRLEQLDYLVKKFKLKCDTHESWTGGKEEGLSSTTDYQDAKLSELRALSQKQAAFENELGAHQARVEKIVAIAEELK